MELLKSAVLLLIVEIQELLRMRAEAPTAEIQEPPQTRAEVPTAEMLTYANELRAMTQGRGRFVMVFDRYEPAPKDVADKVIATANAKKKA